MTELTQADTELIHQHLPEHIKTEQIEVVAYAGAIAEFNDTKLETLETAHTNPESDFTWETIDIETQHNWDLDYDELIPITGGLDNEPEIHELAHEFGWLYIENIREEIQNMQEETMFSPREFVALVLNATMQEQRAALEMDISIGNYRGKKGTIADKIEKADMTLARTEQIREQ